MATSIAANNPVARSLSYRAGELLAGAVIALVVFVFAALGRLFLLHKPTPAPDESAEKRAEPLNPESARAMPSMPKRVEAQVAAVTKTLKVQGKEIRCRYYTAHDGKSTVKRTMLVRRNGGRFYEELPEMTGVSLEEAMRLTRMELRQNREIQQETPVKSETPIKQEPVVSEVKPPRLAKKYSSKALRVTEGELVDFGMKQNRHPDGTSYQCYCADIRVDGGAVVRVRGADLERAIEESQAQVGETIKACFLGRTKVDRPEGPDGKKGPEYKNLWSVEKI